MEVHRLRLVVPSTLYMVVVVVLVLVVRAGVTAVIDRRMMVAMDTTFDISLASQTFSLSSSCECKMRCLVLPSCISWSLVITPSASSNNNNTTRDNSECRISNQGPEDLDLTVQTHAVYGYKLSGIKSDIGVITGPDNVLYMKSSLYLTLQGMRDHCKKIPGFRLVILKTPVQFKFAKEYLATVAPGSTLLSAVEHNAESTRLSSGIGGEEVEDEEMDVDDPMPSPQPHSLPLPPPTQSFDVSLPFETNCDNLEDTLPAMPLPSELPSLGQPESVTYELVDAEKVGYISCTALQYRASTTHEGYGNTETEKVGYISCTALQYRASTTHEGYGNTETEKVGDISCTALQYRASTTHEGYGNTETEKVILDNSCLSPSPPSHCSTFPTQRISKPIPSPPPQPTQASLSPNLLPPPQPNLPNPYPNPYLHHFHP
ncbi:hypothetical protein Pmani_008270 [Petrolisthes manimaculis]|uniref:Uncharacterized protein n=1 Tax=Petrolisthes manimaculis TaxID=1843537 RepID=A0AAE1UET1_9EUCA|nr:hypothetical protein Pmani_008270 [Petrolisthes manimaculis]